MKNVKEAIEIVFGLWKLYPNGRLKVRRVLLSVAFSFLLEIGSMVLRVQIINH
jgi:hypothetical protein